MRLQPNRDYISDDVVQTPAALARQLVEHFQPWGRILEPCKGKGNVLRALKAHAKRNLRLEIGDLRPETGNLKPETAGVRAETGNRRPETGDLSRRSRREGRKIESRNPTPENGGLSRMSGASRSASTQVSGFESQVSTVFWCELQQGRDFFDWDEQVDWIITNPPWSQIRAFLQHAMRVADHVVFLLTINHIWTKARIRDIREAGFGLREIVLVDMPPTFPQSGFQLGAVYLARGWKGQIRMTNLAET